MPLDEVVGKIISLTLKKEKLEKAFDEAWVAHVEESRQEAYDLSQIKWRPLRYIKKGAGLLKGR